MFQSNETVGDLAYLYVWFNLGGKWQGKDSDVESYVAEKFCIVVVFIRDVVPYLY